MFSVTYRDSRNNIMGPVETVPPGGSHVVRPATEIRFGSTQIGWTSGLGPALPGSVIDNIYSDITLNSVMELDFSSGSGVSGDPFIITNDRHLQNIRKAPYSDQHFKLGEDVDVIIDWSPSQTVFSGVFDGGGYHISTSSGKGLFSHCSGATFRDISVTVSASHLEDFYGTISVSAESSQFENCHVSLSAPSAAGSIGGIINMSSGGCSINESSAAIQIIATGVNGGGFGGAMSTMANGDLIDGFTGRINLLTSMSDVGGVVGRSSNSGVIRSSFTTGSISSTGSRVGGIAGIYYSNLEWCYSTIDVSGDSSVGGVFGEMQGAAIQCYSGGAVLGGSNIGGFAGKITTQGTIVECYSSSYGSPFYGLLTLGTFSRCYYDASISGSNSLAEGIHPLPTIDMKRSESFTDWDYVDIWSVNRNGSYPYFTFMVQEDLNDELPDPEDTEFDITGLVLSSDHDISFSTNTTYKTCILYGKDITIGAATTILGSTIVCSNMVSNSGLVKNSVIKVGRNV